MTEILTESFCERCGTRYTFESARPRTRLKGVKVLSRGLKNFVMSDETSMDEAMAAARSETDRELTTNQLDAFHKTFNFCMSCRQYTCPNCWNEAEARCLSCAPHLGHEIMPAPFPDMPATTIAPAASVTPAFLRAATTSNGSNGSAHPAELIGASELIGAAEIDAGTHDDEFDAAARLATLTGPVEEPSHRLRHPVPDGGTRGARHRAGGDRSARAGRRGRGGRRGTGRRSWPSRKPSAEPEALAPPEPVGRGRGGRGRAIVAEPVVPTAEPEAVVAEPEAVPEPEPVAASDAVAAEANAEPDVATAPEADLAAAAIVQEAAEPDAVVADEPAATEHEAGAALAPLAAAAVIESIVADEPAPAVAARGQGGRPDQRTPPPLPTRPESRRGARSLRARPHDGARSPPRAAASAETPPARPDTIVPELAAAAALARRRHPNPRRPAPAPVVDDVVAAARVADGRPRSVQRRRR